VVAKESVTLNPHYKTLGLTGSEYHTYTLPKRVGQEMSQKLLDECLPISASYAKKIGMVDEVFEASDYYEKLHSFAKNAFDDDFVWEKQEFLEEHSEEIEACKEREIEVMYLEFWEEDSAFHELRRELVWKICATKTPERLKSVAKT